MPPHSEYDPDRDPVYVVIGPFRMIKPPTYNPNMQGENSVLVELPGAGLLWVRADAVTPVPGDAGMCLDMQWLGARHYDEISAGSSYAEDKNDNSLTRLHDELMDYRSQVRRFRKG
jgi:hypothetical protein